MTDWTWAYLGMAGMAGTLARAWMSRSQATWTPATFVSAGLMGFVFGVAYPALAATPVVAGMLPLPHGNLIQTIAVVLLIGYVSDHVGVNVLGRFGIGPTCKTEPPK